MLLYGANAKKLCTPAYRRPTDYKKTTFDLIARWANKKRRRSYPGLEYCGSPGSREVRGHSCIVYNQLTIIGIY